MAARVIDGTSDEVLVDGTHGDDNVDVADACEVIDLEQLTCSDKESKWLDELADLMVAYCDGVSRSTTRQRGRLISHLFTRRSDFF